MMKILCKSHDRTDASDEVKEVIFMLVHNNFHE